MGLGITYPLMILYRIRYPISYMPISKEFSILATVFARERAKNVDTTHRER